MNLIEWITSELAPREVNSETFLYDEMESQSGYCLPLIYQPFDASDRSHWRDRGEMFDYRFATQADGKHLLDFGPGDGWPSLIVAPYAAEVVGVDGSQRRVRVCRENASRMGITNARFEYVVPGSPLPFPDASFDGVMAASSVEQTPDPQATLREFYRVLRPGGRLRIAYESLGHYRGAEERILDVDALDETSSRVVIYDRQIEQERARMLRLDLSLPQAKARTLLQPESHQAGWAQVQPEQQAALRQHASNVLACTLTHPSGETFERWLAEIGFRAVLPTYGGGWFAGMLFDQLPAPDRPTDMTGVDALLQAPVNVVVQMLAPLKPPHGWDPMITAVK